MSRVGTRDLSRKEPFNQCTAHRKNGEQCKRAANRFMNVCNSHGGRAPQTVRRAQQRILEATDKAAGLLVEMMQDKAIEPALKVKVAQDLLSRAGLSGKQTIEVGVVEKATWEMVAEEILVDVEEDDDNFFPEDIVDAEVVEDDPTQRKYDRDTSVQQDLAVILAKRDSKQRTRPDSQRAKQPEPVKAKRTARNPRPATNGTVDRKTGKHIPPSNSEEAHEERVATNRERNGGGSRSTQARTSRG